MHEFVLVLNAGSSSLKFAMYRKGTNGEWASAARGQLEGIGSSSPRMSARDGVGKKLSIPRIRTAIADGHAALESVTQWLRETFTNVHILGVGHRVVHGGTRYVGPAIVTPELLTELHGLIKLAPLHQPYNLAAIEAVAQRLPEVPQVACFDTSFHRGRSAVADIIPLPRDICAGHIQRYGFHGLSYEYIASVLPEVAPTIAGGRVVVAHLGSGASLCALHDRCSVDNTFGFTPLDGLCMGTRPGAIDPGVILYLFQSLGLTVREVEAMLYKHSGLLGISGISNDMRVLLESNESSAKLAVDYFVYRAAQEIGALAAVLGGIEGLVFTGGIGENSPEIRRRVCEASAWLGINLDPHANGANVPHLSDSASHVSVWMIPTNEELMIARHTGRLLGLVET